MTKKCRMTEPKRKSANARSGDTLGKSEELAVFAWIRNEAASTNWPTVDANPAMKELKGKLVTATQYPN